MKRWTKELAGQMVESERLGREIKQKFAGLGYAF